VDGGADEWLFSCYHLLDVCHKRATWWPCVFNIGAERILPEDNVVVHRDNAGVNKWWQGWRWKAWCTGRTVRWAAVFSAVGRENLRCRVKQRRHFRRRSAFRHRVCLLIFGMLLAGCLRRTYFAATTHTTACLLYAQRNHGYSYNTDTQHGFGSACCYNIPRRHLFFLPSFPSLLPSAAYHLPSFCLYAYSLPAVHCFLLTGRFRGLLLPLLYGVVCKEAVLYLFCLHYYLAFYSLGPSLYSKHA